MNLTDAQQRAIYEWLYEELKGKGWRLRKDPYWNQQHGVVDAAWEVNGKLRLTKLPPLDMNTAFSEYIPKLKAEFRSVKWDGETWTIYVPQCYGEPVSWKNTDFYAALLQYLGVK